MTRQGTMHSSHAVMAMDPYESRTYQANLGYWSGLEQDLASRGTDWAALVAANPYKNIDRKQGILSKIGSFLGLRTSYDKFLEQQQMNSNEYLANLQQKAYQEDYESPAAEAERMRAAGMNPDLLGVEGVNGAGQMPEESGIDTGAFDVDGTVKDVGSFISQAISMAFGFAENLQTLKIARNAVKSGNIQNAAGLQDLTMKTILNNVPADQIVKSGDGTWLNVLDDDLDSYVRASKSIGKSLGFRGSDLRDFQQNYKMMIGSLSVNDEMYQKLGRTAQNKVTYYRRAASRFLGAGESRDLDPIMVINKDLQDMFDDLEQLKAEGDYNHAEAHAIEGRNKTAYQGSLEALGVPEAEAALEGTTAEAGNVVQQNKWTEEKAKRIINSHMDDLIRNLEEQYQENPDPWVEALIYAFSIMRLVQVSGAGQAVSGAANAIGKGLDVLL